MSGGTIARPTTAIPEDEVQRYNFAERAYHWINAIAYTYLMLTGLAIFTPLAYWLAYVLGRTDNHPLLAPLDGLIYLATIFWMHRMWKRDMQKIPQDEQWSKNIRAYAENRDEVMPPQGRFNAGQKQFWWVMLYHTFILLITGIIMWIS